MPFPFKPRSKTIKILVGDDEIYDVIFVPVTFQYVYPLKQLGKKLAEAVADFGSAKKLVEGKREDVAEYDRETKNLVNSRVSTEPVAETRIEKSAAARKQGIEKLIGLFLEEGSIKTLADMISSSLRHNEDERWRLTGEQLRDEVDLDLMVQLAIGLVEVHQGILDPLLRMRELAATVSGSSGNELSLVDDKEETEPQS